jgi:hypothetical protein
MEFEMEQTQRANEDLKTECNRNGGSDRDHIERPGKVKELLEQDVAKLKEERRTTATTA